MTRPSDGGGTDPSGRAAVGATFDRIAERFAATRASPWPEVESFLAGREGRVGLDVGCGNGRHAGPLAARVDRVLGVDLSAALLGIAREDARGAGFGGAANWVRGDAAALPVCDDGADLAVHVATVHHLPTRAGRVASLDELARALAPGGRGLVSAWSVEHDRFEPTGDGEGFDTTVDWTLPDGEQVPRFYHVYAAPEFEADLAASACRVHETFVSSGNCYAVVGPGGDREAGTEGKRP